MTTPEENYENEEHLKVQMFLCPDTTEDNNGLYLAKEGQQSRHKLVLPRSCVLCNQSVIAKPRADTQELLRAQNDLCSALLSTYLGNASPRHMVVQDRTAVLLKPTDAYLRADEIHTRD